MDGLGGWYEDFFELSTERPIGMGIGPIPAFAIDRYTALMSYDDADMCRACIRAMDNVWLEVANRRDEDQPPPDAATARDAFREGTRSRRGR